jgi:threonine aldolase
MVANAKAAGVLISAMGARTVRAVTHMDVSAEQCRRAAELLAEIVAA